MHNILTGPAAACVLAASQNGQAETPDGFHELAEVTWETLRESLLRTWEGFVGQAPYLVGGVLLFVIIWIVIKLLDRGCKRAFKRADWEYSRRMLFLRLVNVGLWVVGLLIVATVVLPGLTVSRALAGVGFGSVALGFAFKDILENFLAGILILWRFPFDKGDFITCQDITGRVEDITIRNTLLRRVTGELVVMPNAKIFKNPVDVLTHDQFRQLRIIAGVGYDEDVAAARTAIKEAVSGCDTVVDRPIEVFVQEFGASSVNFEVGWWAGSTPLKARESMDEVIEAIKARLDEAEIEIPYSYMTLTFKEPLRTVSAGTEEVGD